MFRRVRGVSALRNLSPVKFWTLFLHLCIQVGPQVLRFQDASSRDLGIGLLQKLQRLSDEFCI